MEPGPSLFGKPVTSLFMRVAGFFVPSLLQCFSVKKMGRAKVFIDSVRGGKQ